MIQVGRPYRSQAAGTVAHRGFHTETRFRYRLQLVSTSHACRAPQYCQQQYVQRPYIISYLYLNVALPRMDEYVPVYISIVNHLITIPCLRRHRSGRRSAVASRPRKPPSGPRAAPAPHAAPPGRSFVSFPFPASGWLLPGHHRDARVTPRAARWPESLRARPFPFRSQLALCQTVRRARRSLYMHACPRLHLPVSLRGRLLLGTKVCHTKYVISYLFEC
jgi:hypothetical protein